MFIFPCAVDANCRSIVCVASALRLRHPSVFSSPVPIYADCSSPSVDITGLQTEHEESGAIMEGAGAATGAQQLRSLTLAPESEHGQENVDAAISDVSHPGSD